MRKIGNIATEAHAQRFAEYLTAQDMAAQADEARDGAWEIWVHDDNHLAAASEELAKFESAPDDARYLKGARVAKELKKKEESEQRRSRTRVIDARSHMGIFQNAGVGPFTIATILLCVGLYVIQKVTGPNGALERLFLISTPEGAASGQILPEVRNGQVWRLFTPALLHGPIIHILFNMLWVQRLGGAIENIESSMRFLAQVFVFAVAGNLLQYFTEGWRFYGMSGAVYGLFGYYWVCARHDPTRPYVLDQGTVVILVGWFLLGYTGMLGPIANGAHAGGLIAGIVWAMFTVRQIPFTRIRF